MSDRCQTCRFWRQDHTEIDPNDAEFGYGQCRRRPPSLVSSMIAASLPPLRYGQQVDPDVDILDAVSASQFPATFSQEWCGDFEGVAA